MISVSGFREKDLRILKMHKITNHSIKNRGSNMLLNKSCRGPPKKKKKKPNKHCGACVAQR